MPILMGASEPESLKESLDATSVTYPLLVEYYYSDCKIIWTEHNTKLSMIGTEQEAKEIADLMNTKLKVVHMAGEPPTWT